MLCHVLSIRQPWASLIMAGIKHHETRTWKPAHRGLVIIQAAKNLSSLCQVWDTPYVRQAIERLGYPDPLRFPRGVALGTALIGDVVLSQDVRERLAPEELALGDFERRFAWQMLDPRPFVRPFPLKGGLSIMKVEIEIDLSMFYSSVRKP